MQAPGPMQTPPPRPDVGVWGFSTTWVVRLAIKLVRPFQHPFQHQLGSRANTDPPPLDLMWGFEGWRVGIWGWGG